MIRKYVFPLVLACILGAPIAHGSTIGSTFAGGNINSIGGMVFFDIDVLAGSGIVLESLSTNVYNVAVGTTIYLEIYTRTGTSVGYQTSASGWTLASSGTGISASLNSHSFFEFADFLLAPGLTGIGIRNVNYSASYTNGSGGNEFYGNADLSLALGSSTNRTFDGTALYTPRVWNGDIDYEVVPEPGTMGTFLLVLATAGGLAAFRRHRLTARP